MDDWLKSLKVGDEVCYTYTAISKRIVMTTVAKITPTGKIRTADGKLFDETGFLKEGHGWNCTYYHLSPITDEIRYEIRCRDLLNQTRRIKFPELTNEQLEEIVKIAELAPQGR
jgi:hypothetical protein